MSDLFPGLQLNRPGLNRGDREALAQSLTRVQQTAAAILQAIDGDTSMTPES
jgi:hypothetical protein